MPSLVTNEGSYRGRIIESAVGMTSTGLPQFIFGVKALEWYDPDQKEWLAWEEYDEGITGYLCLFGKDGQPLKNAEQVMKVFGWDGTSFADLDDADLTGIDFQFRVTDEEYEGKTRRKVQWIDVYDATPGGSLGTVEKLDAKKRDALDKQFGAALKKLSGGKVKTAKAPTTKPKPAPKKEDTPEEPKEETKAAPPKRPPASPKKDKKSKVEIEYTYESAWDAVVAATPDVDDDERATAWCEMLQQCVGDKSEDRVTPAEWAAVVDNTKKELATH